MRSKSYLFMISIVSAFFLYGCRNERGLQPNLEINNEDLRSAIVEYDSLLHTAILESDSSLGPILSEKAYLITVYEEDMDDSITKYSITFSSGTDIMENVPILLANVEDRDVIFIRRGNGQGVLRTDKNLQKDIARQYFPKEYEILTSGKSLGYQIINDCPWMELKFCKGKLVHKRLPTIFRKDGTIVPLR